MSKESVEIIKEKAIIQDLYTNVFSKNQTFLKINEVRIKIDSFKNTGDSVQLVISETKDIPEKCIAFTRYEGEIISALLKFESKQENNVFNFSTIEIRKYNTPRKEKRQNLVTDKKNEILYIANVMSDFLLERELEFNDKKVKQISDIIKIKLESHFHYIKIYLLHEGSDARMDYFKNNIRPIYIPNINIAPSDKNRQIYELYKNKIRTKDNILQNNKKLVSEVSVPILYRMKIPYGYVQVNNINTIEETSMSTVKKMAVIAEELMQKNNIFPPDEVKLVVSNISKNGLGVVFKDRKCIKYFKEEASIYFDLLLPDNKKANIIANVRHISQISNAIYKIGCQFKEMDALSEVYFEEFLETLE